MIDTKLNNVKQKSFKNRNSRKILFSLPIFLFSICVTVGAFFCFKIWSLLTEDWGFEYL